MSVVKSSEKKRCHLEVHGGATFRIAALTMARDLLVERVDSLPELMGGTFLYLREAATRAIKVPGTVILPGNFA